MEDYDNILGIKGISGNLHAGVGFVIIPDNLDIDEYKEDVYQSGRISIFGGYGHSNFYNILIDKDSIQKIEFPEKAGEMGSPVVWINLPKHNEPIIIACLKYDEDYYSLSENRKRLTAKHKNQVIDLDLDAKNNRITLSAKGDDEPIVFNVKLTDKNSEAIFKLNIDGQVLWNALKRFAIISKRIELGTTDGEGVVKSKLILSSDEKDDQLYYEDFNGNKVIFNKDHMAFKHPEKIDFGEGKEKMVLGETLKKIMERYDDALAKLTVPTAFGPSGTRLNEAEFKKVRKDFKDFLSDLTNTD